MSFTPSLPLIFSNDILNPIERIQINDGVSLVFDDKDYENGSVIPKRSFNFISKVSEYYYNNNVYNIDSIKKKFVAVVNIKNLADYFYDLKIHKSKSMSDVSKIIKTKAYTEAIERYTQGINAYFEIQGSITPLKVGLRNKPAETITVDTNINKKIGLHLDSWDRQPLTMRDECRNRICLNLGEGERHFIFLNKTVIELLRELELKSNKIGGTQLGRMFLMNNSSYPITKITVKPGEAYIAPTENIIHDGSNTNNSKPDITFTMLGNFFLRKNVMNDLAFQ